ncbi:MAG: DNA primase [Patescibacteria group bacterium]
MMNPTEEIKARLDIVDIIGSYINLALAGANWRARCPFHNEKTPSFMVSKEKQIWHCFGCGKGGDVITFVQEYEGLTFPEALRQLAQKANVVLPEYTASHKEDHGRLYDMNQLALEFYQKKLAADIEIAEKVQGYLTKRKITSDSIKKWQLGLSGEAWDELYLFLREKNYQDDEIFQAGLIVKKKNGSGYVDRFRKRLMFPLSDASGKVVAFTSRTLAGIAYVEDDFGGKYINSPQTSVYDKGKILYGWHLAKEAIRQKKYLIIVEGNMDAIACHQAGTTNTVAVSGTALTIDHLKLIKRYTDNIILAFDGDTAGSQAAFRSITLGWQVDFNIKILVLPPSSDPADMVKDDPAKWRQAVKEAIPVMDYYFLRILSGVDLNRADHKKIAVQKLLPIIKFLKSQVEQVHYLQALSDKLNIPISILQADISQAKTFLSSQEQTWQQSLSQKKNTLWLLSDQLLAIAFYRGEYLDKLLAQVDPELMAADLQSLYRKVIIYYTKHHTLDNFADNGELESNEKDDWVRLSITGEKDYDQMTERELSLIFENLVNRLKLTRCQEQHQTLREQLKQAELAGDIIKVDILTHQINLLNKELNKLQR